MSPSLLSHAAAEADDAALARIDRIGDLPTQDERLAFVRLGSELGRHARLSALRHVFQAGGEIVDQHDIAQRLIADVVEAEREVDELARLRHLRGGDLDQPQLRRVAQILDGVELFGAFVLRDGQIGRASWWGRVFI